MPVGSAGNGESDAAPNIASSGHAGGVLSSPEELIFIDERPAQDGWVLHPHAGCLVAWTGAFVDPFVFSRDELGLTGYLRSHGIEHFSGREFARPINVEEQWLQPHIGKLPQGLDGTPLLIPGRQYFPRLAALAYILEGLRSLSGEPIVILHAWRPPDINRAAKGERRSDHLYACAVDVQFRSLRAYELAERRMRQHYASDLTGISWGYNSQRLSGRMHVGLWAPETIKKGANREWDYAES